MFCKHCGSKNVDGAVFCKKCGKPLSDTREQVIEGLANVSETKDTESIAYEGTCAKKSRKLPVWLLLVTAVGVVLILIITLMLKNIKPTINLDDYLSFEAEGYDGYGKVGYNIDWDSIEDQYEDKVSFTKLAREDFDELFESTTPIDFLKANVSVDLDCTTNVSNGDEIAYSWDIDADITEYIKCNVKFNDGSYSVSGLKDVGSFDAFSGLTVFFSGVAPNGIAEIQYSGSDLYYGDFSIDRNEGLKNGDTIKVDITNQDPAYYAEKLGKIPESFEKEYKVEGLDEYVSTIAGLNPQYFEIIKKEAEDVVSAYAASSYNQESSLGSLDYEGYVLNSKKKEGANSINELYIILSGDVSNSKGDFSTIRVYYPVRFKNVLSQGGNTTYDENVEIIGRSDLAVGLFGTKGYLNPLSCYMEIVDSNRDSYDTECGDGFEKYAEHDDIMKLNDIDESYKEELRSDAKDTVESYIAKNYTDEAITTDLELKGEYLLTAKDQGTDYEKNNIYVVVYETHLSSKGGKYEDTNVYFPVEYKGIVKLPDDKYMLTNSLGIQGKSSLSNSWYYTKGFIDGEEMYSKIVTANRDNYTYEVSDGLKEFGD